jgi:DNA-binding LacI/PurR family transcriptional regulator
MTAGLERLSGYRDGLAQAGLPVEDSLIEPGDFSLDSGARAIERLLERRPDLDAVFAASDPMAIGAMRVLRDAGRRVPEDVAVVGFDDSPSAAHTDPPLTTVHQPVEAIGREMVRLLMARIGGGPPEESLVVLPTHLVVRGST